LPKFVCFCVIAQLFGAQLAELLHEGLHLVLELAH
jgi:hypothetical protein